MFLEATKSFLCGQVVSVFSLMALVMSKRLLFRGVTTPMLLNLTFYTALGIVYAMVNKCVASSGTPAVPARKARWWFYPFLALIDVQANICALKALEYTSFASTGMVLNLAVPIVFTLCVTTFGAAYKWTHVLGCILAATGSLVVLAGCLHRQSIHAFGSEQEIYGWVLAVLAACLYGTSNVVNQWWVKVNGIDGMVDCLSKVGAWGALFCALQVVIAERVEVAAIEWNSQIVMLFVGYVLSMFAFYTAVYVLVRESETTMYNLSLLFSSVYLMLIARYTLDETLDLHTWVAMVLTLIGLCIYAWNGAMNGDKNNGLPQIGFKSMSTPREVHDLVANKLRLAEV